MKRLFLVVFLIGILPMVFAEEADVDGDIVVDVPPEDDGGCHAPEIFVDPTARLWNPNDQTYKTADIDSVQGPRRGGYGHAIMNVYCDLGYVVEERQNYMFAGETLTYYVAVYDEDGADDIVGANLVVDDEVVGGCLDRNLIDVLKDDECQDWDLSPARDYLTDHMNLDTELATANDYENYKFFVCTLIAQDEWEDPATVKVQSSDGGEVVCVDDPNTVESSWSDMMDFNPDLALSLTGGPIDFGTVVPESTSLSNTIYVGNEAEDGSGVVMDMYIASDDYFTDPGSPDAICGDGNGIKYTQFSYYATKGSINSGLNGHSVHTYYGLGAGSVRCQGECACMVGVDEFTPLTSHSGHIEDMCRIINVATDSSLLTQGAEMSVTFKLEVPTPCEGSFTDGQFHFVGRVV